MLKCPAAQRTACTAHHAPQLVVRRFVVPLLCHSSLGSCAAALGYLISPRPHPCPLARPPASNLDRDQGVPSRGKIELDVPSAGDDSVVVTVLDDLKAVVCKPAPKAAEAPKELTEAEKKAKAVLTKTAKDRRPVAGAQARTYKVERLLMRRTYDGVDRSVPAAHPTERCVSSPLP